MSIKKYMTIACIVLFIVGCNKKEIKKEIKQIAPNYSTQEVVVAQVDDELALNGKIDFDQRFVGKVFPIYSGLIKNVYVEIGDYVKKGQPLAIINSSEVADLDKDLKASEQRVLVANNALKVAQDMNNSGIGSKKDVMIAQQEEINANAEKDKIKKLMHLSNTSKESEYILKSPVDGFVVEKNITKGMFIRSDHSEQLFTISGMNEVLVNASVYESDVSKVKVGDDVVVIAVAYPDKEFNAKIENINNMISEDTKAMTVRVRLKNKGFLLKPGMFATVYVKTNSNTQKFLRVDAKSVIFDSENNYVVVVTKKGKEEIRKVEVYSQNSRHAFISKGIKLGEKVINKNALLVYKSIQSNI